ncbi:LamG domain-containing protein [Paenibacillus kobensis]|uniref:LamG domain-containing protein n=1 Tax=Paenibacillus kobensis TaxID=59841 RepID=UPI000FD7025E|nr:LamG domain-containing protein [Paenibacillus kobensis]
MSSLREGLVAEYLFNGNAEDTSGSGHHGTVSGAVLTANRLGEPDRAYAFLGEGGHIVLAPHSNLNADAFSLSVWVKYDESAALKGWNSAIVSQDDHGREQDQSRRVFQLSTKGPFVTWHRMRRTQDAISKQPIQPGVWFHLVAVYGEGQHKLYLNGELQDTKAGEFGLNADEPIYIGKKNSDEQRFWFHGALDDIRLYNRALSDGEAAELYTEHGYTGDPLWSPAPPPQAAPRKPASKNKWLNKPIRVRKTLDHRPLEWNDCYNAFALSLYGIMQYSNRPVEWPQVLVYTGLGFAINTDTTVAPMNMLRDGSLLRSALGVLGFEMDILAANLYGGDWEEDTVDRALYMMRDSIQRGLPVMGWNLNNYEHGLIYGYDDKKRVLNIQDINTKGGGELSYDEFGRRPLNGRPIEPEMFILALRERDEAEYPQPHLSVTRYGELQDRSYKETLRQALSLAISHIDGSEEAGDGRRNGIAAIEAWKTAFETGSASSFFTSYNLLWVTSTRQYLIPFFSQSAITHCMAIQDHTLQRLMLDAAEAYLSSYRSWLRLRKLFPFPHGADTTDPQLRSEAIRLLNDAREAEEAGLAVLRSIIEHLSAGVAQFV